MPRRIVDGDALWRSEKLRQVQPAAFRAEYANLVPIAKDDGTFEYDPRRIWADVYSFNREDIAIETVEQILAEFERVGLLERKKNDRWWGKWTGIDKSGRLPPPSQRYNTGHAELFEPRAALGQPYGNPSPGLGLGLGKGLDGESPTQPSNAKTLRITFRQKSGKKLTLGKNDKDWDRYAEACRKYGTETVDRYFGEWAAQKRNDFKERDSYAIEWFLNDLDVMVEGDELRAESEKDEPTPEEMSVVQESIARFEQERQKVLDEEKAEKDRMRQHYPDDAFCSCPQCQPDFWKEEE